MDNVLVVIGFAIVGETAIEAVKPALEPLWLRLKVPEDVNPYLYLSLILGIVLAFAFQLDLLHSVGLAPDTTVIGTILTGLFVGRGSNFAHDLISALSAVAR